MIAQVIVGRLAQVDGLPADNRVDFHDAPAAPVGLH
jgi:hypothetical protein